MTAAETLRAHWPEYLCEALGLGLFMVSAGACGTALFASTSPLAGCDPLLARSLMGLAMGVTAVAMIYSPWGRRSGGHFNPATTLTFFRLGKIEAVDALAYVLAQCAGGIVGVLAVAALAGRAFTAPPVATVVTVPGEAGAGAAWLAEIAISCGLMAVVLLVSNSPRSARFTGICAGCLVALYITFEAPLSGMSMNPARSLASALPAGRWTSFWVYLTGPPIGMLAAAEAYLRLRGHGPRCAKLHHDEAHRCIFRCGYCGHVPATPSSS